MEETERGLDARSLILKGLVKGPKETEEMFKKRLNYEVPLLYSNKKLAFFEGGATWIDLEQNFFRTTIQLRSIFKKKEQWLYLRKQEILEHENIHAMRVGFEEPIFEEVLAYRTSKHFFRKYFGPLFRNVYEAYFLLLVNFFSAYSLNWMGVACLLGVWGFFLWRNALIQKIFAKVEKLLPFDVLVFLTDEEIIRFANMTFSQVGEEAKKLSLKDFRWKQLLSLGILCPSDTT